MIVYKRIAQRLIVTTTLLMLFACTSENVIDIYGRDNEGLYGVQTSFPISKSEAPVYLKLQLSKTRADFLQDVPDGKFVDFENIQLWGPDSIAVESVIRTTSVSFGTFDLPLFADFSSSFLDKVSSSFFIGFSQTEFDADVVFQSGPAVSIRDNVPEVYFDIGLWYQSTDKLKLGFVMAFTRNTTVGGYSDIQLSLNYQLHPHMELAVGLRDFFYDYNNSGSASTLFVESRGPFIVLNFPF